jgi:small-conductance mechanosensitive channel
MIGLSKYDELKKANKQFHDELSELSTLVDEYVSELYDLGNECIEQIADERRKLMDDYIKLHAPAIGILNSIRNRASTLYKLHVPEITNSLEIPAVGYIVMNNPEITNEFVKLLINVLKEEYSDAIMEAIMKDENDRIVDSPEYYLKEFKDNKRFGEE